MEASSSYWTGKIDTTKGPVDVCLKLYLNRILVIISENDRLGTVISTEITPHEELPPMMAGGMFIEDPDDDKKTALARITAGDLRIQRGYSLNAQRRQKTIGKN